MRLAVGALRRDRGLADAAQRDPASLMSALLEAARLGLEPGTEQYYLTVRGGKVLGITGYQGDIELIYRAGAVSSVIVETVHQHDKFSYTPGRDDRPLHEIDWDLDDRGPLRLACSEARTSTRGPHGLRTPRPGRGGTACQVRGPIQCSTVSPLLSSRSLR